LSTCKLKASTDKAYRMFEVPHKIGLLQQPARYHCLQPGQRQHEHKCNRFCQFEHVVGNVYTCTSSGTTHVCDANCAERVQLDAYTSVCRLSKRAFVNNVSAQVPGASRYGKSIILEISPFLDVCYAEEGISEFFIARERLHLHAMLCVLCTALTNTALNVHWNRLHKKSRTRMSISALAAV